MSVSLSHVPSVLRVVILEICRTVFTAKSQKQSLTRSSILLISFVIVHALGNGVVFGGKDAFNGYARVLHSTPIIPAIEVYLALSFLIHALSAINITLSSKFKRKALAPRSFNLNVATLAISGTLLLIFLLWHVFEFRFGNDAYKTEEGSRDLFTLQLEVFSSAPKVAFYELAVVALGVHLCRGWTVSVRSLDFESAHRPTALLLGQALTAVLCGVFAACPLLMHFHSWKSSHSQS